MRDSASECFLLSIDRKLAPCRLVFQDADQKIRIAVVVDIGP